MHIEILPVVGVWKAAVQEATSVIRETVGCRVTVGEPIAPSRGVYDAEREQYEAEPFADIASTDGRGDKNLVLTQFDITVDEKTFVFGCTYLEGDGGVVSYSRFGAGASEEDGDAFVDRLRKQVLKQFAYMIGRQGCDTPGCPIALTATVAELDATSPQPCATCREQLQSATTDDHRPSSRQQPTVKSTTEIQCVHCGHEWTCVGTPTDQALRCPLCNRETKVGERGEPF